MRLNFIAVMFAAVAFAACGGDDAAPSGPTGTAPAAATVEESVWVRQLCMRDRRFGEEESALPGVGPSTGSLTLAQERARAELVWPALAKLNELYAEEMARVDPPERVAAIHDAVRQIYATGASEMRRSIDEIDQIFASEEALNANNERRNKTGTAAISTVDGLLRSDPGILALYRSLPECTGAAQ